MNVDVHSHTRVSSARLLRGWETPGVGTTDLRLIVRQCVLFKTLSAHRLAVNSSAEAGEDRIPVATDVIDGNVPLRDRHLVAHGDHDRVGKREIRDAIMHTAIGQRSRGDQEYAKILRFYVEIGRASG